MASVGSHGKQVLMLIEDGSFLYDNRVKREAKTLVDAGYTVVVICPRYPGETPHSVHDDIHVYRYNKWNIGGHLGEYSSSLLKGGFLAVRATLRHGRFDCIHACNPPDIWFLLGVFFKILTRTKFIFDHHDICPELYISRFGGDKKSIMYKVMLLMEKLTFKASDGVISTNASYKRIAMTRGGRDEDKVMVVRNGPILDNFPLLEPDPEIKRDGRIVVGYIGNMNPQDGVDHLLHAANRIVNELGRKNFFFVFIGKGDSFEDLNRLKNELKLDEHCRFTGRIPDDEMLKTLNSCDICVQPDPKNPLNDHSTMNKAMEYMALEKPVVAYDLVETRYSCGDCALYASSDDYNELADKILQLSDDEDLRISMGKSGRERIKNHLEWTHSEPHLLEIYKRVLQA